MQSSIKLSYFYKHAILSHMHISDENIYLGDYPLPYHNKYTKKSIIIASCIINALQCQLPQLHEHQGAHPAIHQFKCKTTTKAFVGLVTTKGP